MNGKNLYFLGEKELPNRQPDIHEMIRGLETEIARGELIYTKAEIAKLDRKLEEYKELYRVLTQS
jgi:hypothetical protein